MGIERHSFKNYLSTIRFEYRMWKRYERQFVELHIKGEPGHGLDAIRLRRAARNSKKSFLLALVGLHYFGT